MMMLLKSLIVIQGFVFLGAEDCTGRGVIEPGAKNGVTADDQKLILNVHNKLRNDIAGGATDFPEASNMRKLGWDPELAAACQALLSTCNVDHRTDATENYEDYGQNLARTWGDRYPGINWTNSIVKWYNEISKYPVTNEYKVPHVKGTGHFTQTIWADSYLVGCAFQQVKLDPAYGNDSSRPYNNLYCCNYVEVGNVKTNGRTNYIYKNGKPCSDTGCTCDNQFKSLCNKK